MKPWNNAHQTDYVALLGSGASKNPFVPSVTRERAGIIEARDNYHGRTGATLGKG